MFLICLVLLLFRASSEEAGVTSQGNVGVADDINQLKAQLKQLNAQLDTITTEKEKVMTQFVEMETKLKEYSTTISTLQTEKEALEKQVGTLTTKQSETITQLTAEKAKAEEELDKQKEASEIVKQQLAKEIATGMKLAQDEAKLTKSYKELMVKYEQLQQRQQELQENFTSLNASYMEAVEHLAHPQLSEYLAVRGREIGQMRPELKAALTKAQRVFSPHVNAAYENGKAVYSQTERQLRSHVEPYVGSERAYHVTVGVLSFLMVFPVFVLYKFVHHLHQRMRIYHVMVCLNFWGMSFFIAVFISSFFSEKGRDVLKSVQQHNPGGYAVLQLCIAVFFVVHIIGTMMLGRKHTHSNFRLYTAAYVSIVMGLIWHYYVNIWSLAMLDVTYTVSTNIFLVYAFIYGTGVALSLTSRQDLTKYSMVSCTSMVSEMDLDKAM